MNNMDLYGMEESDSYSVGPQLENNPGWKGPREVSESHLEQGQPCSLPHPEYLIWVKVSEAHTKIIKEGSLIFFSCIGIE